MRRNRSPEEAEPVENEDDQQPPSEESAGKISSTVVPSGRKVAQAISGATQKAIVTPQILFLIVASIFGIMMLTVNPMYHVPDEPAHFWKAYSISEGHLLPNAKLRVGKYMPESFNKMAKVLKFKVQGAHVSFKDVRAALKIPMRSQIKGYILNMSMEMSPPVPYIPQAIGIGLGRLFNAPPLVLAYLGRLFNLFAWLALVYFAIVVTPLLKWTFFLLGIMPMAIHQAASLSADCVTLGLCFLLAAFIFKLAFDRSNLQVTRREIIIIFVLAALLALCKPPYFLLSLLFLMIPTGRFRSRKFYYGVFALLLGTVLVIGLAWTFTGLGASILPSPNVSVSRQLSFVVHHPFAYGKTLLRSMNVHKDNYLGGFIGAFGWFETGVPIWFTYLFLFALISVSALEENEIIVRTRQKVANIVSIILIFLAILTTFYLYWTNVGAIIIQGVQGRYLIPLAPPFFLLFYNRAIKYEKGKWFYVSMVAIGVVAILISISKIWARFY